MTTHSPAHRMILLTILPAVPLRTLLAAHSVCGTRGVRGDEVDGWPNFDSTDLASQARNVERVHVEAVGWRDVDPSSITIAVSELPAARGPYGAAS